MINSLAMTLPTGGPTVEFYQQWSQYLSPMPHIFLTLIMLFMYSIALIFYYLATGVLDAYTNSFKLLDFMNIFFSPNNKTYQDWHLGLIIRDFLYLGFVAFGLMMLFQWIVYIATEGRKGREWPKGISITMGVIMALPFAVGLLTSIGTSMSKEAIGNPNTNVITQLWSGNSTDLNLLAKSDFKLSNYNKIPDKVNDKKITGSDYHSVMSDTGYTDGLSDSQKKVFTQKIGGNGKLVDTTGGTLLLGKTFADEYPVMKTNWLGIIAGEIVFIFVVIAAIVRLFTAVYKMAFMTGSIVYFGLRDGTQGKRVREIMSMIEGQITGIVIMPISLIFFFAWIEFAFGVINNANLGIWPFTILSIAALVAGAKGLFTGFDMIEQWTGVHSGHANPVASVMLANQAAKMVGGVAKSAKAHLGKGINAVSPAEQKKTRELGQKLVDSHPLDMSNANTKDHTLSDGQDNTGKLVGLATGAGRVAGAAKNPSQLLKSSGRAALDQAKTGIKGAVDGVKDYAGGIKDGYTGGEQAVQAFNQRHTPVDANGAVKETPQDAHEALRQAGQGIERSPESELQNGGARNASTGESNSSNLNQKMQGARSGLQPSPGKNYIDGGYLSRKPATPTTSGVAKKPASSMSSALPGQSQSHKKQVLVSSLSPEELKAHDHEVAMEAIRKQMAKGRKDKDTQ